MNDLDAKMRSLKRWRNAVFVLCGLSIIALWVSLALQLLLLLK